MKKIEHPLDNSGGLYRMYAIPESTVNEIMPTGPGVCSLLLQNLTTIICIECLPIGYGFSEEKRESDSGDLYEVELSGFIHGITPENDAIVDELRTGTWIVAAQDTDGLFKLVGANDVRLVFECKTSTGTARSGSKGTSFSFKCTDQYPSMNMENNPF